jgi:hypothetical protein
MNAPVATLLAELPAIPAFAVLTLDGRQWLVPQAEVQSLESLTDLDRTVQAPGSLGALAFQDDWWPVFCLSGELRLLAQLPPPRRVCLLLSNGTERFGLVCDQVGTLDHPPRLHPLPRCMTLPATPLQALALLDQGLGCVTTTARLAARLIAETETADG